MARRLIRVSAAVLLVLALCGAALPRVLAAGPTFTLTVPSAFLRALPAFEAERTYSAFQNQTFDIIGRTADSNWLMLAYPGAGSKGTWMWRNYGRVAGDLNSVPVAAAALPAPTPTLAAQAAPTTAASAPAGGGTPGTRLAFTVAVRSFFARSAPNRTATPVASLFSEQTYAAVARTAAADWLLLELGGGKVGWAPAGYGTLKGTAALLPVGNAAPAAPPPPAVAAAALPQVSARAREIYQRGLALGNNPRAFAKVGDCNSTPPLFLAMFDQGVYRLGPYAHLQGTISYFAGSFERNSVAARDGMNVDSMFDPIWANPAVCERGESPIACEYRVHRPSIALVSLGTNGAWLTNEQYEAGLRRILDFSIERGVLPVLSTKADNLEGDNRFNQVIYRLAAEYELPLWDYAAVAQSLPGYGLADAYRLTTGASYYDDPAYASRGWPMRNLTALQALEAVRTGVE